MYCSDNLSFLIITIATLLLSVPFDFSALTLLVRWQNWQDGHLACKNFCFKTPWESG